MQELLTLSRLQKIQDELKKTQPFSKRIVGTIINHQAWTAIKEEIEANTPRYIYELARCDGDYLWGAPVYGADIDPDKTEIYFDKNLLAERLKNL